MDDLEEDDILKAKHNVYDALYEDKPTEASRIFFSINLLKGVIKAIKLKFDLLKTIDRIEE